MSEETATPSAVTAPVWSLGAQALGRSDFVRLLYGGLPEAIAAELTGFVARSGADAGVAPLAVEQSSVPAELPETAVQQVMAAPAVEPPPPIWRAIGPVVNARKAEEQDQVPDWMKTGERLGRLGSTGDRLPELAPLLPPARLGCVLRQHLRSRRPGNRLDFGRLVNELSRCRALRRLPRVLRPTWPDRLQLYWDRTASIAFAHEDQRRVYRWLDRWYARRSLELVFVEGQGRRTWKNGKWCPVALPDQKTAILALSDFGMADDNRPRQEFWAKVCSEAMSYGAAPVALLLCPSRRWSKAATQGWHALEWERARPLRRHSASPLRIKQEQRLGEHLIALLSPLLRIEPALLRDARKLLRTEGADLGTELDAWLSPHVDRRSRDGMALSTAARLELQPAYMKLPLDLRNKFQKLVERHHQALSPLIRAEEMLALGSASATEKADDGKPATETVDDGKTAKHEAHKILKEYARRLDAGDERSDSELLYLQRLVERQPPSAWKDEFLAAVWALAHRNPERNGFNEPLPDGMALDPVLWTLTRKPQQRWVRIMQTGNALRFMPIEQLNAPMPKGSLLADLPLRIGLLRMHWRDTAASSAATTSRKWILDVDRDERVELPLNQRSYAVLESDLASLEIRPLARPAWASRIFRNPQALRVKTEIVKFDWHEPEAKEAAKPGFIGRLLGKSESHPASPGLEITRVISHRDVTWPAWATNLERDSYGLVATLRLAPEVSMRLRWVPAGRFLMGSPPDEKGRADWEGPQHWVELSSGFWVTESACAQGQWEAVMGNNPSEFKGDARRPVEQVSWDDCQEFCKLLNAQCPNLGIRLPTEAEWEYACRAGTASAYNDGSACTEPEGDDPALEELGWFNKNSEGKTQPVGEKLANAWGIHDMHGNVWEWCSDWYGDYSSEEQRDPMGPEKGLLRVIRGGGWDDLALDCRSAYRIWNEPGNRRNDLGFRLVAVQSSEPVNQAGSEVEQRRSTP